MRGRGSRIKFGRRSFQRSPRPKKLGVIRKRMQYIPEDIPAFPTIVNVPLHPKTGQPMMSKRDIQERKKLHKGVHSHWLVLLMGNRGEIIQREIFA